MLAIFVDKFHVAVVIVVTFNCHEFRIDTCTVTVATASQVDSLIHSFKVWSVMIIPISMAPCELYSAS